MESSMDSHLDSLDVNLLSGLQNLNLSEDRSGNNSGRLNHHQQQHSRGLMEQSSVPQVQYYTPFAPNNIWAGCVFGNAGSSLGGSNIENYFGGINPGFAGQSISNVGNDEFEAMTAWTNQPYLGGNPGFAGPSTSNVGDDQSEAMSAWASQPSETLEYMSMMGHHDLSPTSPSGEPWFDSQPAETRWDRSAEIKVLKDCDMVGLAATESGSRSLQLILKRKDPLLTSVIFERLIDYIITMVVDQHGHYLFMKLIEESDAYQLEQIVIKLTRPPETIVRASLSTIGSYSIRKLIQVLKNSPLSYLVVSALAAGFLELMTHQPGMYVISRCLALLNSQQNMELYRAATDNCMQLAIHDKGYISLNDFISGITGEYRDCLLDEISDNTVFLSQDPRGNFVVQHILELQHPTFTRKICSLLQGHYVRLSVQKCGSHVVEKCLKSFHLSFAVHDLMKSKRLPQVARNQFGNYVIQTALKTTKVASNVLHRSLLEALKPHLTGLSSHPHGNNVAKLINKGVPL